MAVEQGFMKESEEEVITQEPEQIVENEEPQAEPEAVDAEEEAPAKEHEEERRKRQKIGLKTRFNQIQREKYQLMDAVERMRQENLELRQMHDLASQSAMYNYDKSAYMQLDQAKKLKKEALESGDPEAQINADIAIANATMEIKKAEDWKLKQELNNQYYQQPMNQYQAPEPQVDVNLVKNWYAKNPWANRDSDEYDPDMETAVTNYSDQLDRYLRGLGRADLLYGRDYFNEIDAFVNKYYPQNSGYSSGRQIQMKQSSSPVSGVTRGGSRGGYSNQSMGSRGPRPLSEDEKSLIKSLGVSEREYRLSKQKDAQIQREREKERGRYR